MDAIFPAIALIQNFDWTLPDGFLSMEMCHY